MACSLVLEYSGMVTKGGKKDRQDHVGQLGDSLHQWKNSVFGRHLKSGLKVLVSSNISMQFTLFISISPLKEPFKRL